MKVEFYRHRGIAWTIFLTLVFITFNAVFLFFVKKNQICKEEEIKAGQVIQNTEVLFFEKSEERVEENNSSQVLTKDFEEVYKTSSSSFVLEDLSEEKNQIIKKANQILSENIQKEEKSVSLEKVNSSKEKSYYYAPNNNSTNHNTINKKIRVFASCGIAPVFFKGNSFIDNFFADQKTFFLPCITLNFVLPSKTGWNWGVGLKANGSRLEHTVINYSFNQNLLTSTQFYTIQTAILLEREIFSEKNLFEMHAGIGISGFVNSYCKLGKVKCPPVTSTSLYLNCGFSIKHNFSKAIFSCLSLDFNYAFSPTKTFIFFEPAITGGVLI